MRNVIIVQAVQAKVDELELYLKNDLRMSKEAARRRSDRMREFVKALSSAVDYPKCRFKIWRTLGYRCAVFEKNWVFAYEVFEDGIIVRDMSHTSLLAK